jgi:hypothetical protein
MTLEWPSAKLRRKLTPEQVVLHDWVYEFTRKPSQAVLLIGFMEARVVEDADLTFWDLLAQAKQDLRTIIL